DGLWLWLMARGVVQPALASGEWRRRVRRRPHDAGELAALEQFAPFAASSRHFVLGGADRLLCAASGFDRQQVTVAPGRDGAQHAVVVAELDEDHPLARSR